MADGHVIRQRFAQEAVVISEGIHPGHSAGPARPPPAYQKPAGWSSLPAYLREEMARAGNAVPSLTSLASIVLPLARHPGNHALIAIQIQHSSL